jgi:hypothetical protein
MSCSHLNLPLVGKTAFFQGEVKNKCIVCECCLCWLLPAAAQEAVASAAGASAAPLHLC